MLITENAIKAQQRSTVEELPRNNRISVKLRILPLIFYHIKLILKISATVFTPAAQADNVGNAEKRKVAPLGECGLC